MSQAERKEKERSDHVMSANQVKQALESQMEQHREAHQKQLSELRHEIQDKQGRIDQLTELVWEP